MEKLDLKKQWKELYGAKAGVIVAVEVPPPKISAILVSSSGVVDPKKLLDGD